MKMRDIRLAAWALQSLAAAKRTKARNVFLIGTSIHGNLGDAAIGDAERKLLEECRGVLGGGRLVECPANVLWKKKTRLPWEATEKVLLQSIPKLNLFA